MRRFAAFSEQGPPRTRSQGHPSSAVYFQSLRRVLGLVVCVVLVVAVKCMNVDFVRVGFRHGLGLTLYVYEARDRSGATVLFLDLGRHKQFTADGVPYVAAELVVSRLSALPYDADCSASEVTHVDQVYRFGGWSGG